MIELAYLIVIFALSVLCLFAYRQGLKDGRRVEKGNELQPIVKPTRAHKAVDRDLRTETILENIDNFGTKKPQKEVK